MVLHYQHPPDLTKGRKNRRRERPGARKRHSLHNDINDGLNLASDYTIVLPFKTHRSGMRQHQAYERNWKARKDREHEQRLAVVDREKRANMDRQREEYTRLFGAGEDDSLCESMLSVVYSLWGSIDYVDP